MDSRQPASDKEPEGQDGEEVASKIGGVCHSPARRIKRAESTARRGERKEAPAVLFVLGEPIGDAEKT
jgi:hypothetical protein